MKDIVYGFGSSVVAVSSVGIDFKDGDAAFKDKFVLTSAQKSWLQGYGVRPGKVLFPKQVHGADVWCVTSQNADALFVHEADAVITNEPGLAVAVRTADCLPALFYDPVRRVIAAVHAGWKSSHLKIVGATLQAMKDAYGTDPKDVKAAIGPCIRTVSYPVGKEFKGYFPEDVIETPQGLRLDLSGANRRQMLAGGIRPENIADSNLCTFTDKERFYSFRRDADHAGRLISLIMMVS
ncbi:MAG: peptidoglycan editing factor PgeF [Candidatus Omnitrophica bacterium]|nr:peptidoglycan editing factor PgeF [Candidatus Omnitrophota bacterium]